MGKSTLFVCICSVPRRHLRKVNIHRPILIAVTVQPVQGSPCKISEGEQDGAEVCTLGSKGERCNLLVEGLSQSFQGQDAQGVPGDGTEALRALLT